MNDLKKLVILAQSGDAQAYHVFLETVSQTIKRIVSFKVFNESHRDDICQEILISIHHSLPTYSPDRPIMPWINCIIERRIIDYIRKYTKLEEREEIFDEAVTKEANASNNTIERVALEQQLELLIEKCLTDELSKPLLMAKLEGLKTKEISQELGISEAATRTRISRAMAKLKKAVRINNGK
ncbi:RNA polymerase sigma factor [Halobacteriovorax sp. XZX-3]|uniref:RNA polymerase sigma factor n=1 Tax=unclassified Halobacteriovorax TaxID=2639665 RepID=UPI0037129178